MADKSNADEHQRTHARLYTALYGLAAPVAARAFLEAFADVAASLAQNAPLDEDRTDWQCVSGVVLCCLDRPHAESESGTG